MKKYIIASVMGLFLIVGTGLILTATESNENAERAQSCCAPKVEQTTQVSTCTGAEKTQSASAIQTVQTENTSACEGSTATAGCCSGATTTATAATTVAGCAGAAASCTGAATTNQVSAPRPGECTKVPSGIRSQQTSREI